MSTVLGERDLSHATPQGGRAWIAILAGLAALYLPTYVALARGVWRDDAYAHGPIVLAVFAWLVWRRRAALRDAASRPAPWAGAALLVPGLALYLLGRTQSLPLFEVASHLPVIAGAALLWGGRGALRVLAFPLVFLCFLVPLPGFVLDVVASPLKSFVSLVVEAMLSAFGYPVERAGVVLDVGGHPMLVADACSGLNSIYSLFALGLLYTQVAGRPSVKRTALVLAGIVPIAVAANILRVLMLVLVTYHLGDETAGGFLHGFAGMVVFVSALAMLIAYDALVSRGVENRGRSPISDTQIGVPPIGNRATSPVLAAAAAGIAMALAAVAAPALKPVPVPGPTADLEALIPLSFGEWKLDPESVQVAPTPDVQARLDLLYRQIVSRTYVNGQGERMMLTVAHGGDQSDALKAHRQEVCYSAQGFEIRGLGHGSLATSGRSIPVTRFVASLGERVEPVTYWFTMGDRVVLGRAERLRVQLQNGFAGRVPDGMLVRVSSLSADPAAAWAAQQSFVSAVIGALPEAQAPRFVGAVRG